jgi:nicotinate-nucleotide adenylyltransferase
MPIGLYFGSFNPVHIGHLIIANHILNETRVKKIWFVISPQNPFKASPTLLNEYDRLHLLQKAIDGDTRMKAVDIEFSLPKPSYTAVTLAYLAEKYPGQEFQILMGSDSFQNLRKWHNADYIIKNHKILVYRRPGFDAKDTLGAKVDVLDAPLLEISATFIRQMVQQGKSIRYLVPPVIEEEIKENRFFKT